MFQRYLVLLCVLFLSAGLPVYAQSVQVKALQCEMLTEPLGIDAEQPRLSWQLEATQRNVVQTGYEILVASTAQKLATGEGDLWTSRKVSSDQSVLLPYAGKALVSGADCFWKVRVYTNKGNSGWSAPARWSMGLLKPGDWTAKWIGYDKASTWDSVSQWSRLSARYFRKGFQSEGAVKRATVYVVGLGLYELFVNGKKVGDQVLAPNPTDYRKSVLYNTYDVTGMVKGGANAIGAVVGNGRYFTMRQDYKPAKINTFGYPKLLLQLVIEYADGSRKTIVSDESWKLQVDGPIRTNNEYDGEEYDATKEMPGWNNVGFNDVGWMGAELVAAPEGKLVAQRSQPMKVMDRFKPVSVKKLDSDRYVIDMGVNFAGWLQLRVKGRRGERVQLRFAESLQQNGELYVANLRDAKVTDIYTLKGGAVETWHPAFVYHGFRYVEVSGFPGVPTVNDFEGQQIYDAVATTGQFRSSNATINRIYTNAWRGIASNYKGMPIDCPQRNERQPWLGDRAAGALGESFLFDNAALYTKWLDDIQESQTAEGAIPDVAPAFWNYYSDNVTWPGVYILVAQMLYQQYGDRQSVVKHYPFMKKWMGYMQQKYLRNNILTKDKYGDWCVPPESLELIKSKDSTRTTKGELIATAYYYRLLRIMQQFARLQGIEADGVAYASLAAGIKAAFQDKFYNPKTKYYDNNTVTANLLPLHFGITPDSAREAVFNNVYNKIKIENHMHISTGVIGTQYLMRGLSAFDRSDIAYTLASNTSYPSWGYMARNGATTIWELWNGNTANPQMNSQNHVMLLGDLLTWFYEHLAGIRSDDSAVAFKKIIMRPDRIDGLDSVYARYRTPYGEVLSHWKVGAARNGFRWRIRIPANTTAEVYVPAHDASDVLERGKVIGDRSGVRFVRTDGRYQVFAIGSGSYDFSVTVPYRKGIVEDVFVFDRASFPESHASTIVQTPKGLLTAWFGGTKEGYKDVCIWTSALEKGHWTKPVMVADGIINDTTRFPCYNPVLYQAPNGELLLFYKIGSRVATWKGYMKRSKDHGVTWGPREELPEGFLGPVKNKPLLFGNELWCASSTEGNGWRVHFEVTSDWGRTWRKVGPINDGKTINAIQPSILTYADGRWQVLCRSRNRAVVESWSADGGKTWSPMVPSNLPNNNSGTDAVTLKDGRQLLVYNHVLPPGKEAKGARTPLNVAISKDGKNWFAALVLEDSPVSQYSYPSVIQTPDGMVHFVYTWRRERIKYVKVDPSKLVLKPIVNGVWPGARTETLKPSDD
ncbi:family 78 glycoside hydrolase catalytic domain [Paraflavitalea sp. CAU 1676]|uniref:family 78 glycoside hydrolase catalytic domain n=1 Tax=Paraflavitalea sp. CAU 1676 TaxID=3032598 RepID=UPI0023DB9644|nr:family 78 glycoside hydrolase catalytic domain [Paraflavitalea sp. CAU 1676]MDF2190445.1 family 78 glycoside hydrolase catalytic domain [Paraflavitalea sp. CAU 1676]